MSTKDMLQGLARGIDDVLNGPTNQGVSFALFVFSPDERGGTMANYVSNADRHSVVEAMREWVEKSDIARAAETKQ